MLDSATISSQAVDLPQDIPTQVLQSANFPLVPTVREALGRGRGGNAWSRTLG